MADSVAKVRNCKVAVFRETTKREATADSDSLSRVTEVACEFFTSFHEKRAYSVQNFWRPVQNDFCNRIGTTWTIRCVRSMSVVESNPDIRPRAPEGRSNGTLGGPTRSGKERSPSVFSVCSPLETRVKKKRARQPTLRRNGRRMYAMTGASSGKGFTARTASRRATT